MSYLQIGIAMKGTDVLLVLFVFFFLNRQLSVKRTSAVYEVRARVFPFSHNCILSDRATTTTGMGREERGREGENLNWKKVNFCFTALLIKKKKKPSFP